VSGATRSCAPLLTLKALTFARPEHRRIAHDVAARTARGGATGTIATAARDATFTLYSFVSAGYLDEAPRLARMALRPWQETFRDSNPLRLAGERRLTELSCLAARL